VVCDPTGERASAFCSALAGWCNTLSEVLRHKTRSSSYKEVEQSFTGEPATESEDIRVDGEHSSRRRLRRAHLTREARLFSFDLCDQSTLDLVKDDATLAHEADLCIGIQRDGICRIEDQLGGIGDELAGKTEPMHSATLARAAFLCMNSVPESKESSNASSAGKDPELDWLDAEIKLPGLVSDSLGGSSSYAESERATQGLPDGWVANPRVAALCVGIDSFGDVALPNLENCCNDARAMAAQFRTLPLSSRCIVQLGENVDRATFLRMASEFQDQISLNTKHIEVVVVFLASHGFQYGTKLYLATTDTIPATVDLMQEFRDGGSKVSARVERWLHGNCVDVDHVINLLRSTWSGPLAIIVDACRTVPIPELAFKPSELTNSMSYAKRTLVCLSTASYSAAADGCGDGSHSPFCLALLESMFCVGAPLMMSINKACSSLGSFQQPMLASIQFPEVQLIPKVCQIYFLHADDGTRAVDFAWFIASLKRAQYRVTPHLKQAGYRVTPPHAEDIIVVCSGSLDLTFMTVLLELKVELLLWSSEPEKNSEVLARVVQMWEMCSLRRG
jgi:hypothetical protein